MEIGQEACYAGAAGAGAAMAFVALSKGWNQVTTRRIPGDFGQPPHQAAHSMAPLPRIGTIDTTTGNAPAHAHLTATPPGHHDRRAHPERLPATDPLAA